ncbi:PREDICTED: G2 and S phase-expressed protein 1 [Condylura cristata]|uniref:G2 and S phase-expressed protein 1 n=1 Tax=Condylura cristata TaxID=143302 RepID=UPI0006436F55|nr:PREDICTED: G2 and S phase-expressed protein 1 [Condylura cristata]
MVVPLGDRASLSAGFKDGHQDTLTLGGGLGRRVEGTWHPGARSARPLPAWDPPRPRPLPRGGSAHARRLLRALKLQPPECIGSRSREFPRNRPIGGRHRRSHYSPQHAPAARLAASPLQTRQSAARGAFKSAELVPPGFGRRAPPRTPALAGPGSAQASQLSEAGSARGRGSSLHPKTKGLPTPADPLKTPKVSAGEPPGATPQPARAPRPQSCTSAGRPALPCTPSRCASTPGLWSCSRGARTPASTRRLSALPTPAGRRLSGLLLATPRTKPRIPASPLRVPARRLSSEPQKEPSARASLEGSGGPAAPARPGTPPQGSCPPPSAVPRALSFSPDESGFPASPRAPTQAAPEEAQPPAATSPREAILVDIKMDELTITPRVESTPLVDLPLVDLPLVDLPLVDLPLVDLPLVDLPLIDFDNTPEAKVAVGLESRPLIDLLINTPDFGRGPPPKPVHEAAQLIDLTSPLIQLSPEADKENLPSPLLKF